MELVGIAVGVLVAVFSGSVVKLLLRKAALGLTAPEGVNQAVWNALQPPGIEKSGPVLGALERLVAFAGAWLGEYELLVAWLAFKVASKWEVWSNVLRVPDSVEGIAQLDYLKARRVWGSVMLMRFLLGTLANMLIGIASSVVIKAGLALFH